MIQTPKVEEEEQQKPSKEETPITKHARLQMEANSERIVDLKFVVGETNTKVFCAQFDNDDQYIAAACQNGELRVYNTKAGKLSYVFQSDKPNTPFTYIRWRPGMDNFKTQNVFITVNSDGQIQHWHLASGQCLSTIKEESFDPQLFCVDYNKDATKFAVCGSEPIIKIYDEEKRGKPDHAMGATETFPPGHTSRVYCVQFDKENPNVLYSGGWDYRVIMWDTREGQTQKMGIYGPLICGDGIDISAENQMITSSWTSNNQLQLWDIRTCKLFKNIDWDGALKTSVNPCFLYASQFSKNNGGTLILAGGSNSNEVKIFDTDSGRKPFVSISELCREVNTVDFSNNGEMFCFSGGDGQVRLYNIQNVM